LLVGRIQRGVDPHACRARITFAADDSLGLQPKRLSDKCPRRALLTPFLSVPFRRWRRCHRHCGLLRSYGLLANIVFAFIAAYLTIVIGRWVLGKKNL
jgi:hypothetical protein